MISVLGCHLGVLGARADALGRVILAWLKIRESCVMPAAQSRRQAARDLHLLDLVVRALPLRSGIVTFSPQANT